MGAHCGRRSGWDTGGRCWGGRAGWWRSLRRFWVSNRRVFKSDRTDQVSGMSLSFRFLVAGGAVAVVVLGPDVVLACCARVGWGYFYMF